MFSRDGRGVRRPGASPGAASEGVRRLECKGKVRSALSEPAHAADVVAIGEHIATRPEPGRDVELTRSLPGVLGAPASAIESIVRSVLSTSVQVRSVLIALPPSATEALTWPTSASLKTGGTAPAAPRTARPLAPLALLDDPLLGERHTMRRGRTEDAGVMPAGLSGCGVARAAAFALLAAAAAAIGCATQVTGECAGDGLHLNVFFPRPTVGCDCSGLGWPRAFCGVVLMAFASV